MKIALIHTGKKITTGAHYINELIFTKLKERDILVKNFYPKSQLFETPFNLKGIANIIFFYSLIEHKQQILTNNIIQGTTYTVLPFLSSYVPVISFFGSTSYGFLLATPLAKNMEQETRKIWYSLRKRKIIPGVNIKTRRPLRDVAEIEKFVASKVNRIIATSLKVKEELAGLGINADKIEVIHNAIEDYWFSENPPPPAENPHIVFLGRLSNDPFTLKIKGADRLIHLYLDKQFSAIPKTTICMGVHKPLKEWLKTNVKNHTVFINLEKKLIPNILGKLRGSIFFLPSRYEGFSLSLVEAMSQGLVPVAYPVGVAPEVITNGVNGFLVQNQKEAISRVAELLANKSLRISMSRAVQKTSFKFKSERMIKHLVEFYKKCIDDHKNKASDI